MRIAVITEVSTSSRNPAIMKALQDRDHKIFNVGMTGSGDKVELSYIHTSFMTAFLLEIGVVDFVVGGCGTGQGYAISTNMYPGVYCGLIYDPLEAWLFPQINAGKAISLALNKQYGWAGEENLKFIFDALLSAPIGKGYPEYRCESQAAFRNELDDVSKATHRNSLKEIMEQLEPNIFKECAKQKAFMDLVRSTDSVNSAKKYFLDIVDKF